VLIILWQEKEIRIENQHFHQSRRRNFYNRLCSKAGRQAAMKNNVEVCDARGDAIKGCSSSPKITYK
jgi:hypothetical protein